MNLFGSLQISEINCWLHNWLSVVTSGSWISQKVVSCISSSSGIIKTGIIGFYGLTMTVDLLPFLLTKNLGIWAGFQVLKIQIGGGLTSHPFINREIPVGENIFSVFFKKNPCFETLTSSFLTAPSLSPLFSSSDGRRKRRGRRIRKWWSKKIQSSWRKWWLEARRSKPWRCWLVD